MSAAPTGHASGLSSHAVIYLQVEDEPVPFLAFSADDLELYAKDGEVDVSKDCSIILGCQGTLYKYLEHVKGSETSKLVKLEIGQAFVFVPSVPRSVWQHSMIPFTEIHRRASSKSSSSSSSSNNSALRMPSIGSLDRTPGLVTQIHGLSANLPEEELKKTAKTRQQEMRSILEQMDSSCQVTGRHANFCDAAHLVKVSNPDIAIAHIIASRYPLYPSNEEVIGTFAGSYDSRLAILLDCCLHRMLDANECYFRVPDATNENIKLVAASPSASDKLHDFHVNLPDGKQQPLDPDSSFAITRNPADMAPLQVFWDWFSASRLLALYATQEALELSKQCVLVRVVEEWKQKVKASKASRRNASDGSAAGNLSAGTARALTRR